MRILFLMFVVNLFIFADTNNYPKVFYKMSEPLFNATSKFENYIVDDKTKQAIQSYSLEVNKVIKIGLQANKINSLDEDKKKYLFALRKLQKDYDFSIIYHALA